MFGLAFMRRGMSGESSSSSVQKEDAGGRRLGARLEHIASSTTCSEHERLIRQECNVSRSLRAIFQSAAEGDSTHCVAVAFRHGDNGERREEGRGKDQSLRRRERRFGNPKRSERSKQPVTSIVFRSSFFFLLPLGPGINDPFHLSFH